MRAVAEAGNGRTGPPAEAVALGGETFLCDFAGCLYWPAEDCLIVSDLHLEKGSSFARRGQLLPPYDTAATLGALERRLEHWQPRRVISLGDSFHDPDGSNRLCESDRLRLGAMMEGRDWIWIGGNHDPQAPDSLGGDWAETLAIGPIVFRHEPGEAPSGFEIAGHLHPQARIVRRGKRIRRRCFAADGRRLIMPAFGAYAGGLNLREPAFRGLFDEASLCVHIISRDMVYRIRGSQLV